MIRLLKLLAILPALLAMSASAQLLPAQALLQTNRPLVIGHRGYPALVPENTLASFDAALKAGVDLVELDYHHSSDGIPMVLHDGTLDRTTDAVARWGGKDLAAKSRTSEELSQLDVGSWFRPALPFERLPSLERALDLIQRRGVTLIERKDGDAATLARLLREKNWVNHVVVQAFDWDFLRHYRALDATQVLGALGPWGSRNGTRLSDADKALQSRWIDEARSIGVQVMVWNRMVSRPAIEEAHAKGLKVWIYTINEEAEAQALLHLGVDGIITDNPAILWKAQRHPR